MEESYETKRNKNNEAVKKSREKSRSQTQQTVDKINKLKNENSKFEEKNEALEKEIEKLKTIFIQHAGNSGGSVSLSQQDIDFLKDENVLANK